MGKQLIPAENTIVDDPFVFTAPVRTTDFCNREGILDALIKVTVTGKAQGNLWITGERQVGKTSLLRYIHSKYEGIEKKIQLYGSEDLYSTVLIYLNVQDIKNSDDFYRYLRHGLKNRFDFKIETHQEPYRSFIDALDYLYSKQKYFIVFLLDEFDALVEHLAADDPKIATTFLASFSKLLQGATEISLDQPKVFSCVFAANHTIDELLKENGIDRRGSGMVTEYKEMKWFTREQIEELAQHYLKGHPISFVTEELDLCFKLTHGYPYFVQKLFSILYEHKIKADSYVSCLPTVMKEYGEAFGETVRGWGTVSLPSRTRDKLLTLSKNVLKNVKDESINIAFKLISEYLKAQGAP